MNYRRFSVIGIITLVVGIILLTPRAADEADSADRQALYVGEDVCFTCHEDFSRSWVDTFRPRLIEAPISNPHAAADTESSARHVELLTRPGAYSMSGQMLRREKVQEYILETDTGLLVLPGHYQIGGEVYYAPLPDSEPTDSCADCHAGNFEVPDGIQLDRSAPNRPDLPLLLVEQLALTPFQW